MGVGQDLLIINLVVCTKVGTYNYEVLVVVASY